VTTMLSGCAAARDAAEASAVFEASLAAGLQPDRIVYNALSHAYAVGGEVEGAIQAREGERRKMRGDKRGDAGRSGEITR